ncbi:MAG: lysylphosphatidylglycerol synthase transmembrane domain-containing protein [Salibacteraceae bacterium]
MKKKLISLLKVVVPLLLGVGLTWYIYQDLSEEDKAQVFESLRIADYSWIAFSILFAILSHLSRGWRWKYTLEPLDMRPKFLNNFFSVMIGYIANLAFPRLGEASRCAALARYENLPFNKLFGTVIAERVADFAILLSLIAGVILFQLDKINEIMSQPVKDILGESADPATADQTMKELLLDKIPPTWVLILLAIGGIVGLVVLIRFLRSSQQGIALKVRDFIGGLLDGLKSILVMRQRWSFIGHTFFIWLMYILMFYVSFFSLPGTSNVPLAGVITAFVMGGISIVVVQGGLGVYPAIVAATLQLYGVDLPIGFAFGWIMWAAQTVMILVLGGASFPGMALYNKKPAHGGA